MEIQSHLQSLDANGFTIIPSVYPTHEVETMRENVASALLHSDGRSMKSRGGVVYAARNILEFFSAAQSIWLNPRLIRLLEAVLGSGFGLVRGLYFDKPPERSWSLPWHKDMTIAVKDNSLPSNRFQNPTRKSGIDHVEAPEEILKNMLTLRIHLDDVTKDNGALQVVPGSHCSKNMHNDPASSPQSIYLSAGDVLAMRPLLTHCSGNSSVGSQLHRRTIHLEFAAGSTLPDSYQWQHFWTTSDLISQA